MKTRSAGITAAAAVSLLGSLFLMLVLGLSVVGVVAAGRRSPQTPGTDSLVVSFAFCFIPAVWGLATSVGLFRLQPWARISVLIFAGLLALTGVGGALLIPLAMPSSPVPGQSPESWQAAKTAAAVFLLSLAAIGVWWLILFNLRSVKDRFSPEAAAEASQPPAPAAPKASPRPLSISIIAGFFLFGSAMTPVTATMAILKGTPIILANFLVTGWVAVLWLIASGAVGLYSGLGLWRLRERARRLAIGYVSLLGVNLVLSWVLPGADERFMALLAANTPLSAPDWVAAFRPDPHHFVQASFVTGALITLAQLYFLVTRRPAFARAEEPPLATLL